MSEKVTIEISEADMAELREWAHNSERSVEALVEVALQQYMIAIREDHADLEERMKGPFYSMEEVEEYLAARRQGPRIEAAE
jgi:predicted transcriptional regulator